MSGHCASLTECMPSRSFLPVGGRDQPLANHNTRFQMLWRIKRLGTVYWGAHRTSNILSLGGEESRSKNSSLLEGLKGKKGKEKCSRKSKT